MALPELIELVRESNPFQRARLEGLGSAPLLEEIPPLTKDELVADQRAHPPFGTNLTHPPEDYVQIHQTSGSTGPPLRVLRHRRRLALVAGHVRPHAVGGRRTSGRPRGAGLLLGPHVHSGPPATGCRSWAPRRCRWAGWPRYSA